MTSVGSPNTRLIVLRGNSGSGKSSVARELRARHGWGLAWVEQDYFRRIILRELDVSGGVNIGLIDGAVRYALAHGYHVVLEGIFRADNSADMLRTLNADHAGQTAFYYFDISFEETARRHLTRPQASGFSCADMLAWYRPRDLLGLPNERVIGEMTTLQEAAERILLETNLSKVAERG